jgi:cell division protein FtsI (penicillin-binding protein 3)
MVFTGVCLGLGMLAALGQVFVLQTVQHEELVREASRNYSRNVVLDGWRGDIIDRDGALLASTVHRWFVSVDPSHIEADVAPETAAVLAALLGDDTDRLLRRITGDRSAKEEAEGLDPSTRIAREVVAPMVEAISRVFGGSGAESRSHLRRKMKLLEYFYRMDQLRARSIYGLVDTLALVGEGVARAFDASTEDLRFFRHRTRRFAYLVGDLDDATKDLIVAAKKKTREEARSCREHRRSMRVGGTDTDETRCVDPLSSVRMSKEPRRYYPKRELGTQLIGLVGRHSKALEGMERATDGILKGSQHATRVVRDIRGRSMILEGIDEDAPISGPSVELTIDQEIQALSEQALTHACEASGARAGYAIVMHVETGEILAAASFPTYNPNNYRSFFKERQPLLDEADARHQSLLDLRWAASWPLMDVAYPDTAESTGLEARRALTRHQTASMEHAHGYPSAARHTAFQNAYEPGSIMKVFTLAAWLETEVRPRDHLYSLMDGNWELKDSEDNVIHDDHRHYVEEADAQYAIQTSSNIIFGQMGLDLESNRKANGALGLEDFLRSFGFGAVSSSGFPGEASGLLRPADEWPMVETANVSFGQGISATGIQLVTALSALGNDGKRMKPLLVRRVLDSYGREIRRWEPEVVLQVVSPEVAQTVVHMMKAVVEPGGTGTRAAIPEYPVAGKTGTGQKAHIRSARGYAENMWVGTFFGLAPAEDPKLATLVLIDEPQGKRYGGVVAAPAFREITRGALALLGEPSPFDVHRRVAWIDPDDLAKRRAAEGATPPDLKSAAAPVDPFYAGDVPVPDFGGMTMDQVLRSASNVGLRVRLGGSGTAVAQDISPQTRTPAWSTVSVHFEPRTPGVVLAPTIEAAQIELPAVGDDGARQGGLL